MNVIVVFAAKYLFLLSIILGGWFFFTIPTAVKKNFVKLTLISSVLAFSIAKVSGAIFNDPRPFVSDHLQPLIAHAADNGFPSDHTLLTMLIASVVFVYNRKLGVILAIVSCIVGLGRVLSGVHHTIDILGAIIITVVSVAIARALTKRIALIEKIR